MTTEQAAASFDPEDASGLLDDARVVITNAQVVNFTAKAGQTYVNLDVTYKNGEQDVTEHYLIGGSDQWAPNKDKTGVIPVGREGGKIWNRSDVVKFWASLKNAGFRNGQNVGNDCSVLKGLDVHVKRVTTDGTYKDKEGKERQRAVLLVTKIYGQAGATGQANAAKKPVARPAAKPVGNTGVVPAAAGGNTPTPTGDVDTLATDTLIELLAAGQPFATSELGRAAFVPLTKKKTPAPTRAAVIGRIEDPAFLGGLAEQGLIAFDGQSVSAAA